MRTKTLFFTAITTLVMIIVLVFTTCKKEPLEIYGDINGAVYEEGTTNAVQGVTIVLSPTGTTKTTGSDGKFEFKDLEAKEYTLQASKSGYVDNAKNVKVTVGEDIKADISLVIFIPYITPSFANHSPASDEGNIVLNIEANINWNASSNASDWLSIAPQTGTNNGSVTISWTENTSSQSRMGVLTFSGTGANNQTVTITQAAAELNLSVSPATQSVSSVSGNFAISISSNISWAATSNENWLTLSSTNGTNDATISTAYTLNESANERSAIITFTGSGVGNQTVLVTQGGADAFISITPLNHDVAPESGSFAFNISSNTNWSISDNADWLTLSSSAGLNDDIVTANYSANSSVTSRQAVLTLTATGLSPKTATLTQAKENYYINVTSPTSGTDWLLDTEQIITWEDNIDENVKIELLTDGNVYKTINSSTLSDGSYNWNIISNVYSAFTLQMKITSTSNSSISGTSDFFNLSNNTPTVTTENVSNISYYTATCGGYTSKSGGSTVTERGVCWSMTQNPTIADNKTIDGSGLGSFTSNLIDLTDNTTYYVRAYATNSVGTSYGIEQSFTTIDAIAPIVIIEYISNIYIHISIVHGNVTNENGTTITERGVCYSTSLNPTTADNTETVSGTIGTFSCDLPGLTDNTTYYVRAYAINSEGVGYSEQKTFTTKEDLTGQTGTVTDFDGNIYSTIGIGAQIWMVENLKTTHYADGTIIPHVTDNTAWGILDDNNTDKRSTGYLPDWLASGKRCRMDRTNRLFGRNKCCRWKPKRNRNNTLA